MKPFCKSGEICMTFNAKNLFSFMHFLRILFIMYQFVALFAFFYTFVLIVFMLIKKYKGMILVFMTNAN